MTPDQVAGVALEEAILALIAVAGWAPLESALGDVSINAAARPTTIRGRGAEHQIDVVAEPVFGQVFTNPARLLVEAKAYAPTRRVRLDVVRNAVGTVKDLAEFWRPPDEGLSGTRRYHYRYAIFSTAPFSKPAQRYAYAQDVYLVPLARSGYFQPIALALQQLKLSVGDADAARVSYGTFRRWLRGRLRGEIAAGEYPEAEPVIGAVSQQRHGVLAIADKQFALFLTPQSAGVVEELEARVNVRILRDGDGWVLVRAESGARLFSFDIPDELFALYSDSTHVTADNALRMKAERLSEIQAVVSMRGELRIVRFTLDVDWMNELRRSLLRDL